MSTWGCMISITVNFHDEVINEGEFLLSLELLLREFTKADVRVFKAKMGDDSKIRQRMTPDERSRL